MNISQEECANCLMHGWKPVEDKSTLQLCANCELIKYCGKDCQTEHWKKVHKKHCKYFKDPSKASQWEHKVYNCHICLQQAVMGQSQIRQADNPNYDCIFEAVKQIGPPFIHPHPFPVAGQPGDTIENVIILLWQLLKKFVLTQPWTANCDMFHDALSKLAAKRTFIWAGRKVSPLHTDSVINLEDHFRLNLFDINKEVKNRGGNADRFQLWKIIMLVEKILLDMHYSKLLHRLIDPFVDIPAEFHAIVSQALSNSDKFISTVNQVLEALATQVIPFHDVLKIICDGSLDKTCYFCSEDMNVTNVRNEVFIYVREPVVLFNCLYTGIYWCGGKNCSELATPFENNFTRFNSALLAAAQERVVAKCDFCFRLPPVKAVHRCERCLTVQYCSKSCQEKDWPVQGLVCKEDVEERKKKRGSSARRKVARDGLEELQKRAEDLQILDQTLVKLLPGLDLKTVIMWTTTLLLKKSLTTVKMRTNSSYL